MEFVVIILERFFAKNREDATRIMLHVHQKGIGICGIYIREIAETKVRQVLSYAQEHKHPLQCTMEREQGEDFQKGTFLMRGLCPEAVSCCPRNLNFH